MVREVKWQSFRLGWDMGSSLFNLCSFLFWTAVSSVPSGTGTWMSASWPVTWESYLCLSYFDDSINARLVLLLLPFYSSLDPLKLSSILLLCASFPDRASLFPNCLTHQRTENMLYHDMLLFNLKLIFILAWRWIINTLCLIFPVSIIIL